MGDGLCAHPSSRNHPTLMAQARTTRSQTAAASAASTRPVLSSPQLLSATPGPTRKIGAVRFLGMRTYELSPSATTAVSGADYMCFDDGEWMNDNIMDYYMR